MDNPLKVNVGDGLRSLFASRNVTSVVGIDVGTSFIKAVQLRRKGTKALLDTYGEIALGPMAGLEVGQSTNLPPEKIGEAIVALYKEAKITAHDCVFSLPLTSTLLIVIEMPDLGEEKLKEMIPLEARKYIPISTDEVSLNWWIIPKIRRNYTDPDEEDKLKGAGPRVDVLIAAVHNDILERYKKIATAAGATSAQFEIEIFSTIRATIGRDSTLSVMIDMGALSTKVAMVEDGVVRSTHLINSGSQDVTEALAAAKGISTLEAEGKKRNFGLAGDPNDPSVSEISRLSVERIFAEANRLIVKYQRDKRVTVTKIVLTGGGAMMRGMPELVQSRFEVPVIFGGAFDKVEAPPALAPILKDAGPEFATAIGLALRRMG